MQIHVVKNNEGIMRTDKGYRRVKVTKTEYDKKRNMFVVKEYKEI